MHDQILHPYVGLRNFRQSEGEIFFGREEQIQQLVSTLKECHFLSIIGDSGCGKSSLVRAGLLYNLEHSSDSQWEVIKLRPGFPVRSPFKNLFNSLRKSKLDNPSIDLYNRQSILKILDDSSLSEDTNLLILVDQFEELFSYWAENSEEANKFVDLLLNSCQSYNVYVVIVMRSDFLGKCALFPNLPEAITQSIFIVPRLSEEQLIQTIEMPASIFNGKVEKSLVNRLIQDMENDPNRLPLLQHALRYMWDQCCQKKGHDPCVVTLEDYENIIKLERQQPKNFDDWESHPLALVLSYHANRRYRELSTKEQSKVAEILFRNITDRNNDEHINTRRSIEIREIVAQAQPFLPDYTQEQRELVVLEVINAFRIKGRNFLMPYHNKVGKLQLSTSVTIAHESLISGWNLLHQWTIQETQSADEYLRLRCRAENWEVHKKPSSSLSSGIELKVWRDWWEKEKPTAAWAKRYDKDNGKKFQLAEEFLQTSYNEEQKKKQNRIAKKREQRELKNKIIIIIVFVCIILIGAVLYSIYQHQELQSESIRANESQLAQAISEGFRNNYQFSQQLIQDNTLNLDVVMPESYQHARKLLMQLNRISGGEAQKTESHSIVLNTVATSADGTLLGIGGEKGTLILQNAQNKLQLSGHKDTVRAIAFAPKNQWMVSSGDDQQIIRWSLPEGKQIQIWKSPSKVWSVAISPDEKYIATGGEDNIITLWVADTGEIIKQFEGHKKAISALLFDPSGKSLFSASYDKTVRLWKLETGKEYEVLHGYAGKVQRLALSPNGKLLATSSNDRTIRLWNIDWNIGAVQVEKILFGHQDTVFGVKFTADGNYLASSSADRTVRLWDVKSGVPVRVLQGHTAMVTDLAIQDKQIITVGADKTIKWWDANLPNQHHNYLPGTAISTAIAPDGEKVAVGFEYGMVRVYALSEPQTLLWESVPETQHSKTVQRLAWSADGQWLASASSDTTIKLWHANGKLESTLDGHEDTVRAVIFSPDNRFLISIGLDGQIGTFKLDSTEKNLVVENYFESKQEFNSIEFDQSGTKLLISSDDAVYQFAFNQQSGELTLAQTYSQKPRDTIIWAAFSPNAQQYASVGRDGLIQIYDLNSQSTTPKTLVGHQTTILRAKFSPDSKQLITVSGDATVRFWDLDGNRELFTLNLPTNSGKPVPLWDFDFRCTPNGCFIVVPLTHGRLVWYELGKIY